MPRSSQIRFKSIPSATCKNICTPALKIVICHSFSLILPLQQKHRLINKYFEEYKMNSHIVLSNKQSINLIQIFKLLQSFLMKIIGSKRQKCILNDEKSEKTTAINSQNASRKNSTFLTISRDSQKKIPSLSNFINDLTFLSAKKNKKCLKLTVNHNKSHCLQSDRTNPLQRKIKKPIFNFCQEVPIEQNFYTKIIQGARTQRLQLGPQKQSILQKSIEKPLKNCDPTLTCPKSPINKLIELERKSLDPNNINEQLIIQWQRLLNKL